MVFGVSPGLSLGGIVNRVAAQPQTFRHLTLDGVERLAGQGDSFYYQDLRIALANRVRPDLSIQEITAVSQLDKQLAMAAEQRKIIEEIEFLRYQAWDDAKRRRRDQSQRLWDAGAVFGV